MRAARTVAALGLLAAAAHAILLQPLQPWTVATAAGYKGYQTTRERVNVTKPRECRGVMAEACHTRGLRMRPCGEFPADPVPHNGVARTFSFYACLTPEQREYSCETGPGEIRGEYLCIEMASQEPNTAKDRGQAPSPPPRTDYQHISGIICTCWHRDEPTVTNNNEGMWAYRRQANRARTYVAQDGTTVFLDENFTYVDAAGATVSLKGPNP